MGVYNPKMKMPLSCAGCPFLVYRHHDMGFGSFKDVWIKTCQYEPEDKVGETEKHFVANRAEWCPLEEAGIVMGLNMQEVMNALEKVAGLFPYKEPGNRDSYNEYNEAWNDAIGRAEMEIRKLPLVIVAGGKEKSDG